MAYWHALIGNIGVDDESNGNGPLNVGVGIDSLGMCVISFGTSYAIRIPEADVDKLRDILYDASRSLLQMRVDREYTEVMTKLKQAKLNSQETNA